MTKLTTELTTRLIDQSSGGIKLTELLVRLLDEQIEDSYENSNDLIDEIIRVALLNPDIAKLDYLMDLGDGHARAKSFFYRKGL